MSRCIALIGGGVRSGKSDFALERALAVAGPVALIATAQALDDEMRARIDTHRATRPERVATVEEPLALAEALADLPPDAAVVVDCLTLWVTNLLLADLDDAAIRARFGALAAALLAREGLTVLVTNEVGMGIVPADALSRRFRDLAGNLHAQLAGIADEVYLGTMGLLLRLRPSPVEAVVR
jgi:adenosylcobinamide kinase/adenosylcobinamide-phosphate guanylyltransferase